MSYDVTIKIEEDLIRYYISGQRNAKESYRFWERIYKDCRAFDIHSVHVTVMLNGKLEPMEIPPLIRRLIELNAFRPITCAWVDHNTSSFFDNLVGERLPRPDSMNIRIFDCDVKAAEWLANERGPKIESKKSEPVKSSPQMIVE